MWSYRPTGQLSGRPRRRRICSLRRAWRFAPRVKSLIYFYCIYFSRKVAWFSPSAVSCRLLSSVSSLPSFRFSSTSTPIRTAPISSAWLRCTTRPSPAMQASCGSWWTPARGRTRQTTREGEVSLANLFCRKKEIIDSYRVILTVRHKLFWRW